MTSTKATLAIMRGLESEGIFTKALATNMSDSSQRARELGLESLKENLWFILEDGEAISGTGLAIRDLVMGELTSDTGKMIKEKEWGMNMATKLNSRVSGMMINPTEEGWSKFLPLRLNKRLSNRVF